MSWDPMLPSAEFLKAALDYRGPKLGTIEFTKEQFDSMTAEGKARMKEIGEKLLKYTGQSYIDPIPAYTSRGLKADANKLRYDLMPDRAEEEIVQVLTHGAEKYGAHNWRFVHDPEIRYFAAARRHLAAWRKGERLDPESGLPHLAHAACCLIFLMEGDLGKAEVAAATGPVSPTTPAP